MPGNARVCSYTPAALPGAGDQTGVGGNLPAVGKPAMERFVEQHRRPFRPDPLQAHQQTRFLAGARRGLEDGIALTLKVRKLTRDQVKAVEFAKEFGLQPRRQRPSVAGRHLLQSLAGIVTARLKVDHALGGQKGLDPVDVLGPFLDQALAFPRRASLA